MKKTLPSMFIIVVLVLTLFPVTGFSSDQPYWPDQEWRVSTPEEQGIDSTMIVQMLEQITQQQIDIHSFLLIRNGYLVTEVYFAPYSQAIQHLIYSGTKSVTATLVGIALDEGHIKGVDQKITDFLSGAEIEGLDPDKQEMTIEHLLTMTSGLKAAPSFQLFRAADPINFVLSLPMVRKPGEAFEYNSIAIQLLSAILQRTTGMDVLTYANTKLFTPLGISDVVWQTDSQGLHMGATGLSRTPRDMAKLGYLYLRHGNWNGQQILSKEWIDKATQKHQDTTGKMNAAENDGYGYLWWMNGFNGYSAHGFGGQYIFVIPEADIIAVFTSGLKDAAFPTPYELVKSSILPAIASSTPLTPNPQASQALKLMSTQLEHPEPQPVGVLPETAKRISGKTFRITRDGSGGQLFTTISFTFTDDDLCIAETLWPDGTRTVIRGGLDNVFRMNVFEVDQQPVNAAFKGFWQDEQTFIAYVKNMSQIDTTIHTYTFHDTGFTLKVNSSMDLYSFDAAAELVE